MPQLIFKGVKREDTISLSVNLPEQLSELTGTPIDYFTIERPMTEYFSNGKEFEMYPLIEVVQFDRGLSLEKKMADLIQREVKKFGYLECEVYFTHVSEDDYYE